MYFRATKGRWRVASLIVKLGVCDSEPTVRSERGPPLGARRVAGSGLALRLQPESAESVQSPLCEVVLGNEVHVCFRTSRDSLRPT
jgi:hypothetical protein